LESYRALIGVVMQDDQLFAGSIADNISFFSERPDHERVTWCARQAAIHEDIVAMPMGYATLIGDMGTVLSGGQKQRVVIARALYRQPRVLLLDEATSHLDVEREQQVNAAFRNLRITRVVIAHRPETIRMSGRVVALEQGRIVRADTAAQYGIPRESTSDDQEYGRSMSRASQIESTRVFDRDHNSEAQIFSQDRVGPAHSKDRQTSKKARGPTTKNHRSRKNQMRHQHPHEPTNGGASSSDHRSAEEVRLPKATFEFALHARDETTT